jgi:uncharacterized protein
MKIGVISDTHGLLRASAVEALKGSDLIIHAGDVGSPQVLKALAEHAPLKAVRGNVDRGDWASALPDSEVIEVGELALFVLHDINDLDLDPASAGFKAVIYGHSHRPSIRQQAGVLLLNPGSAGPRRFNLPVSIAMLTIVNDRLEPELLVLES